MVVIEEHQNGSTRKRNSSDDNEKKKEIIEKGSESKRKRSAISLTDLPPNILVEVLTRLPLGTLFVARSVSKTLGFLSTPNPYFINLYSSNAPQILVFQFGRKESPSCLLHMADDLLDYQNSQLKPFFKLPKIGRTVEQLRQGKNGKADDYFRGENMLFLSNSCNGLLYFLQNGHIYDEFLYYLQNGHVDHYRSLVCNPVTREYVLIPGVLVDPTVRSDSLMIKSFWLGYSPGTNQYKVLRVYARMRGDRFEAAAQMFVIGSDSWRDIDDTPPTSNLCRPHNVNGIMYWQDKGSWLCQGGIISFDFEREKFGEVALPPGFPAAKFMTRLYSSIGVLGGCLCLTCNDFYARRVDLWVMRKCGNQEYWTREFVFYTQGPRGEPVSGYFKPVQFLGNGELLMRWGRNTLVCCNLRTKIVRYFRLRSDDISQRVVALKPSFVPLKDELKVEAEMVSSQLRPRGDD